MDLEKPVFPRVTYYEGSEFIKSHELKVTGESVSEFHWENIVTVSPVVEAWARWQPEIKESVDTALSIFSSNKKRIMQIVNYMKGFHIQVTSDALFGLIRLADILLIQDLYNYCKDRIATLPLTKHNFYNVLHACTMYGFEHEQMDIFIRGNLTELSKGKDILKIDPESVELLLTDETLTYWPMVSRFRFIRNWCRDFGRSGFFEKWFDFLDLYKIEYYYLEDVVKKDSLVEKSAKCLQTLDKHLINRKDEPVPFVFVLNDKRETSNVFGLNIEDKHLYRFNFPEEMMNNDKLYVSSVNVPGEVISFKQSQRCIYSYNINEEICKERRVVCEDQFDLEVSHVLDAEISPFFISNSGKYSQISVSHEDLSNGGNVLRIEPFMSLKFVVFHACYNQSMIVMSTTTYSEKSNLYCFNIRTNKMTEIQLQQEKRPRAVRCLLPVCNDVLVVTNESFKLLILNKDGNAYQLDDQQLITPSMLATQIFFADYLIELFFMGDHVRFSYKDREQSSFQEWQLSDQKRLEYCLMKPVVCTYVKRTKPICHIMCPHCDPHAWEKETEDDYYDYYYDDYDDDYYYDDYNYDDDHADDPWIQREMY